MPKQQPWHPDWWETPDNLARYLATLVTPSDLFICEPSAGTGQIVKYIAHRQDRTTVAIEIQPERYLDGKKAAPWATWILGSYFDFDLAGWAHVIIGNPPFSQGEQFVSQALISLDKNYPNARILDILPLDYWSSKARFDCLQSLDAHIHGIYIIKGRIQFLKNGSTDGSQRQIYDAIWDIRPGKKDPGQQNIHFIDLQTIF